MELQKQLLEKYNLIQEKIKELECLNNEAYKTGGGFRYNPTNSYSVVDITSCKNESELINVYSFIKTKQQQYDEAAEEIGLNKYPLFKWCGYSAEDWLSDIKLRFRLLKYDGKLTELKEAKAKIQPHLPQENIINQILLELPF